MTLRILISSLATLGFAAACSAPEPTSEAPTGDTVSDRPTLNIYSARHYDSDRLLYEAFEKEAGVNVAVREANADQLLETMKAEGANSPADVIITSDAGALWRFQNAGLTQAIASEELEALIEPKYRQEDGHWFGIAQRIRLVAYDSDRIQPEQVDEWTDLADPSLKNEICVRTSSNIYNLSLMGEMIDRLGAKSAEDWARGVVSNMARKPQGGDTDQIKAVGAGECSIAITNHYYWARLAASGSNADRAVTEATRLIVPSLPDGGGAHVNITGASVTATASEPDLAASFITFLMTPKGQSLLIEDTKEFPLAHTVDLPAGLENVPPFVPGSTPLEVFGENQAEAQRLFDVAGWN